MLYFVRLDDCLPRSVFPRQMEPARWALHPGKNMNGSVLLLAGERP